MSKNSILVAESRLELLTSWLWAKRATNCSTPRCFFYNKYTESFLIINTLLKYFFAFICFLIRSDRGGTPTRSNLSIDPLRRRRRSCNYVLLYLEIYYHTRLLQSVGESNSHSKNENLVSWPLDEPTIFAPTGNYDIPTYWLTVSCSASELRRLIYCSSRKARTFTFKTVGFESTASTNSAIEPFTCGPCRAWTCDLQIIALYI